VTVWEIMTDAATPYGDLPNLDVVAAQVRAGALLSLPEQCSTAVYADLMVPCWAPVPAARPAFFELEAAAVALGGVMSGDSNRHTHRTSASDYGHADLAGRGPDPLHDQDIYPEEFWKTNEGECGSRPCRGF
jgi:hypothetical protein